MADAKVCKIDGCGKRSRTKGLCAGHYGRMWRLGAPLAGPEMIRRGHRIKWLQDHREYDGQDCLIWPFKKHYDGHGIVAIDGSMKPAARVMCRIAHGNPDDEGLYALHSCGNGHLGCVHPRHLRWGSQSENMQDAISHGTTTRGSKSPSSKLTDADVRSIRSDVRLHKEIAADHGISPSLVGMIKRRVRWGWLE